MTLILSSLSTDKTLVIVSIQSWCAFQEQIVNIFRRQFQFISCRTRESESTEFEAQPIPATTTSKNNNIDIIFVFENLVFYIS